MLVAGVVFEVRQILADLKVKFGAAKGVLERRSAAQGAVKRVGAQQVFVIEGFSRAGTVGDHRLQTWDAALQRFHHGEQTR